MQAYIVNGSSTGPPHGKPQGTCCWQNFWFVGHVASCLLLALPLCILRWALGTTCFELGDLQKHRLLPTSVGYRFIFVWSGLVWPGPGGPVPVARSRWPGPAARSRCPDPGGPGGPVPVPVPVPAQVCPAHGLVLVAPWPGPGLLSRSRSALVAVARSRSRSRSRSLPLPSFGGRVPIPIKRITYAVWPASMSPGMDAQSLPGIWLFYAVLQTTGERQTILRSRNHYRTKTGAKWLPKPTA